MRIDPECLELEAVGLKTHRLQHLYTPLPRALPSLLPTDFAHAIRVGGGDKVGALCAWSTRWRGVQGLRAHARWRSSYVGCAVRRRSSTCDVHAGVDCDIHNRKSRISQRMLTMTVGSKMRCDYSEGCTCQKRNKRTSRIHVGCPQLARPRALSCSACVVS